MQVLFNYGPTYLTDQCQAAGLGSIVQNVVPPGFGGAVSQPPALVISFPMHSRLPASNPVHGKTLLSSANSLLKKIRAQVEGSPSPYGSSCNVNVPNYSTYSRFLYVVTRPSWSSFFPHACCPGTLTGNIESTGEAQMTLTTISCMCLQIKFYAANGFYVVLDNQFNLDTTAKDNPWQWLTWWKQLLNDVILDPQSKNRVMLDLLNEPDSQYFGCAQLTICTDVHTDDSLSSMQTVALLFS